MKWRLKGLMIFEADDFSSACLVLAEYFANLSEYKISEDIVLGGGVSVEDVNSQKMYAIFRGEGQGIYGPVPNIEYALMYKGQPGDVICCCEHGQSNKVLLEWEGQGWKLRE